MPRYAAQVVGYVRCKNNTPPAKTSRSLTTTTQTGVARLLCSQAGCIGEATTRFKYVLVNLFSDIYQGQQCHTDTLGSTVVRTICLPTTLPASRTIYPPQQFLEYFRGYTIEWDATWSALAVQEPSTPSSTASNVTSSSVLPTDAPGYFGSFKEGAPSCVSNMTTLCPDFYTSIQLCHNATTQDKACYCVSFTAHECAGLCLEDHQPNDLLNYVIPPCQGSFDNSSYISNSSTSGASVNWTSMWPDYAYLSDTAYIQLFPWDWDVQPNSTELADQTTNGTTTEIGEKLDQCPTVKSALVSFAIVNSVVFVASVATANRYVTYYLTCKFFGGPKGGKWWPAAAIISVALNLLGNVVNAILIKGTPGYNHVPLIPLIMLWCTRPRLAWLVILLVWITKHIGRDMSTYLDSAVAALMAEVILQATGTVYMGMTVNHARVNEFYLVGHLEYTPHGSDALIMYAGALLWTVSVGLLLLRAIYTFTPIGGIVKGAFFASGPWLKKYSVLTAVYCWAGLRGTAILLWWCTYWVVYYPIKICLWRAEWCNSRPLGHDMKLRQWFRVYVPEQYQDEDIDENDDDFDDVPIAKYIREMGLRPQLLDELATLVWCLMLPWCGQWIFWIGFVKVAQNLYCPPDIWSLTIVWSVCSVVATWFGAAL